MTEGRLRLDDQLCFALYAATNAVVRTYRPLLRELGITYSQYLALMVLWQHGTRTVGELAEHLDLPGHALTPLLGRLERAGLVVRRPSAADRRAVLVELTPAGSELENSAAAVQHRVACATGLSPEALAALRSDLHELVNDMRATAAGPDSMEGQAS